MNPWEILGVAPGSNEEAIKQAFSEKSKTCHPEDDAEGFARLQDAYKAARFLARMAARGGGPDGTLLQVVQTPPAGEGGEGHAAHTQGEAAPAPGVQPAFGAQAQSEAQARLAAQFAGLEPPDTQRLADLRSTFFAHAVALYDDDARCEKPECWEELLALPGMGLLRRDEEFLWQYIQFFTANWALPYPVYNKVLHPFQILWRQSWVNTPWYGELSALNRLPWSEGMGLLSKPEKHPARLPFEEALPQNVKIPCKPKQNLLGVGGCSAGLGVFLLATFVYLIADSGLAGLTESLSLPGAVALLLFGGAVILLAFWLPLKFIRTREHYRNCLIAEGSAVWDLTAGRPAKIPWSNIRAAHVTTNQYGGPALLLAFVHPVDYLVEKYDARGQPMRGEKQRRSFTVIPLSAAIRASTAMEAFRTVQRMALAYGPPPPREDTKTGSGHFAPL